ncbi:MAG: hypothetical protein IJM05_05640 [Bacteroidales bacterium]|nr:hypothetical protein [Bacteroidales bacterium]
MKKIIVTLAALALLIPASAQNNARKIISLTPALPTVKDLLEDFKEDGTPYDEYKGPGGQALQAFLEKHKDAEDIIRELPSEFTPNVSSLGKMTPGSAKGAAMGRMSGMGLSAADIQKLQSGELSEEEQLAFANKVMKAQGGPTSSDLETISKMMEAQNAGANPEQAAEIGKQLSTYQSRGASGKGKKSGILQLNEMDRTLLDALKEGDNRKDEARSKGIELYEKKYRNQVIEIEKGIHQAIMDGALDELPAPGTEARCEAAAKRFQALKKQEFAVVCKFYEEYLPIWRNAIAGAMQYYKTDVMKLSEEREAFRAQQFAQTGSTEFMAPAFTPDAVAQQYFEIAKDIADYKLELPDDTVSME